MNADSGGLKHWLGSADLHVCSLANSGCRYRPVRHLFALFSRLGDGLLWYVMIASLALFDGRAGAALALQMALTGAVGVLLYKQLKRRTARPRPYQAHAHILVGARALDPGSFPSGHTLHAVCFTLLLTQAYPPSWVVLAPVCGLIAASRLVLGLHYPSDVLSGALIGWALAAGSTLAAAGLAAS